MAVWGWLCAAASWAQAPMLPPVGEAPPEAEAAGVAPPAARVDVRPVADDEAIARRIREVIFPRGIAVTMKEGGAHDEPPHHEEDSAEHAVQAEAGLESEAKSLGDQAQQVRPLDDQENLLNS